MDCIWKAKVSALLPDPSQYAAFMGGISLWTGLSTASLMLVSPLLFERLGWRGVAGVTPRVSGWRALGGGRPVTHRSRDARRPKCPAATTARCPPGAAPRC